MMKFYLFDNAVPHYMLILINPRTPITVELNLQHYPTSCGGDATRFKKFKTAFDREIGVVPRSLSIELRPVEETTGEGRTDPASNLWSVTLNSEVLTAVHQLLHSGNRNVALQMELTLTFCTLGPASTSDWDKNLDTLVIEGFSPREDENGVVKQECYWKNSVSIEIPPGQTFIDLRRIRIQIDGSDFVDLADVAVPCSDTYRRIFTEKEFCDFEIVSEDGTVIPCHKIFLWAKSPVFSQMLQEKKFKEARENKVTISDMSTRGINAMLEYLYCGDFAQALVHSDVAFEVLKAADKYDIPDLWALMAKIWEQKPAAWYEVDVALKMAAFLVNCQREGSSTLANKAIRAVALKSEQLSDSAVYHELFPTSVLQGMFKLSLEADKKAEEN